MKFWLMNLDQAEEYFKKCVQRELANKLLNEPNLTREEREKILEELGMKGCTDPAELKKLLQGKNILRVKKSDENT